MFKLACVCLLALSAYAATVEEEKNVIVLTKVTFTLTYYIALLSGYPRLILSFLPSIRLNYESVTPSGTDAYFLSLALRFFR